MLRCLISFSLLCFWGLFPAWAQVLIILSVAAIIFGIVWSLSTLVRAVGGWPAVAGTVGIILAILGTIFLGGGKKDVHQQYAPPKEEPRPTIFDGFKRLTKKGPKDKTKRVYDPSTDKWT